jgi:hypothetical protein
MAPAGPFLQILENAACSMPYQKCKANLANLLTPGRVLATLTHEISFARPSGRDFKEHFRCALI